MQLTERPAGHQFNRGRDLVARISTEVYRLKAMNLQPRRLVLAIDVMKNFNRHLQDLGIFPAGLAYGRVYQFQGLYVTEDQTLPPGDWLVAVAPKSAWGEG